ncbi:carboxylesterase type B [Xylariaceae sp. FL1019]|nr:carboxylesterase type B [Xylariaceae sp. FL1019]
MRTAWTWIASVITFSSICAATTRLTENVRLKNGDIIGNPRDDGGILEYLGIPYAQPPVGDLRWRSPRPAKDWTGVLNATAYGNTCWQGSPFYAIYTPQDEDCLTINVWTPANTTKDALPVMVWVHGGGFFIGGGAEQEVIGNLLAEEGVVVVKFNYRLNAFGFLAHPELDEEGHYSGNQGLQDQIAAFTWVRDNIAAFGGDPGRVTAFGESAGGHAIGLLMSSPPAHGLFHQAIMESGTMWSSEHGDCKPFDVARDNGTALATSLGATNIAEFRAVDAATIANSTIFADFGIKDNMIDGYCVSVDRYVVPEPPATPAGQQRQMRIPTLVGWNRKEGDRFIGRSVPYDSAERYKAGVEMYFGNRTDEFLSLYPIDTQANLNDSASLLIGDLVISEQTWETADTVRQHGVSDVYMYVWNYTSTYSPTPIHGSEFKFVFGHLTTSNTGIDPSDEDYAISAKMRKYWTNFAKYANPNGRGNDELPTWPRYEKDGKGFFSLSNYLGPLNYDLSRFRFIKSLRTNGYLPSNWIKIDVNSL